MPALVVYAVRTCLPPQRRFGMLVPCAAAIVFGLLVRGTDATAAHDFGRVAALALFGLVLPVTTLIVGDAVLGAEIRRGSFTFTWMTPVPTWQITLARWIAGTAIAGVGLAVSFALSAVAAGIPSSAGPAAIAGLFGSAAYVAVFMAIGSIAKRAAVWSLAFVFLVERLLGAALSGIAQLSPSWEARGGLRRPGPRPPAAAPGGHPPRRQRPDPAGHDHRRSGLAITVYRLPRLQMASSTD